MSQNSETMSDRIEVTLPWPHKDLSPNGRLHWARKSKAAKKYRADCYLLTKAAGISIDWEGDIHLWLTFFPPDRRHRDDDNIIASFKSGRDGMAEALGVNDKRFRSHPLVSDRTGGKIVAVLTKGPL